ncbi:MAG: hypothetical protein M3P08_08430 [Thermoproteota archaeon]|nr:hypothetical protein [Thermoproteota archaeon]
MIPAIPDSPIPTSENPTSLSSKDRDVEGELASRAVLLLLSVFSTTSSILGSFLLRTNCVLAMQRGYIILIAGAVLLVSGIVISGLWAGYFAGTIIRENTILSGISIRPAGSVNASTQVIDTSRPISLAIHLERNISTTGGQIPNNILRETVRNPNGVIMTSNEFTKQYFTIFKPDITGKYTVTIYNLGNSPVSIGVLAGNLPFIGANNQVNLNSLSGIIVGVILTIAGIVVVIAGIILLILDRRRITPRTETTLSSSSPATTNTETETIVLASWIDRFIAWLIDFIIVSIGLGILFASISLPFWIAFPHWFEGTNMNIAFRSLGGPWPFLF